MPCWTLACLWPRQPDTTGKRRSRTDHDRGTKTNARANHCCSRASSDLLCSSLSVSCLVSFWDRFFLGCEPHVSCIIISLDFIHHQVLGLLCSPSNSSSFVFIVTLFSIALTFVIRALVPDTSHLPFGYLFSALVSFNRSSRPKPSCFPGLLCFSWVLPFLLLPFSFSPVHLSPRSTMSACPGPHLAFLKFLSDSFAALVLLRRRIHRA